MNGHTPRGGWIDEAAAYAQAVAQWRDAGCPPDAVPVLPSLDFGKAHGHDGPHLPLRLQPGQPAPDLDPEQHFGEEETMTHRMHRHWAALEVGTHWYAADIDADGAVLHTHPIPFDSERDADRAAVRLNARDRGRL